jgi:hypothetical protein
VTLYHDARLRAVRRTTVLLFAFHYCQSKLGSQSASHFNPFIHHSFFLPSEAVEVALDPFQILFITSDNLATSNNGSLNDMTLLSVTRNHLIDTEFSKHVAFQSLTLYESVRSGTNDMFTNGTFVAFKGSAFYSQGGLSIPDVEKMLYLSFLGGNETAYVLKLRLRGWNNLERALIMTMSGNMVDYVNGTMVMNNVTAAVSNQQNQMDKNMSKMIYLISVFVPLAVVFLAGGCLVGYLARNNVKWNKPLDANDPDWQSSPSKARRLRRLTFETRDSVDDTRASIQVNVDAATPRHEELLQLKNSRTKPKKQNRPRAVNV